MRWDVLASKEYYRDSDENDVYTLHYSSDNQPWQWQTTKKYYSIAKETPTDHYDIEAYTY